MNHHKAFIGTGTLLVLLGILVIGGGIAYVTTKDKTTDTIMIETESIESEEVIENQIPTNPPTQAQSQGSSNPPSQSGGNGPSHVLTQSQAESIVYQKWSDCSQGDCSNVSVTVTPDRGEQYLITAIFTEYDDSVSQTKRDLLVIYNNGGWIQSVIQPSPNEWRTCHRGNSDGSTGWTTGNCI